jgi:hypothetical protein
VTAGEAAPAAAPAPEAPAEAAQAAVDYDLGLPEGVDVDQAAADDLISIAKEAKLEPAVVQRLASVAVAMQQRAAEQHAAMTAAWVNDVKADPDIGGDKLPEALGFARKALDAFGTPELRSLLDQTGLGNHPELVRAFVKAGKAMSDDGFVSGRSHIAEQDVAKKLFPSMN